MKDIEFKLTPHVIRNEKMIEIWFNNKFIGGIYTGDGSSVRILSKYPMICNTEVPGLIEIEIKSNDKEQ